MNTKAENYPFQTKERIYRGTDLTRLEWALADAREARDVSKGWNAPAELWYQDDVLTISKIIKEKQRKMNSPRRIR